MDLLSINDVTDTSGDELKKHDDVKSCCDFGISFDESTQIDSETESKVWNRLLKKKEQVISEADRQLRALSASMSEKDEDLRFLENRLHINIETLKNFNLMLLEKDSFIESKNREIIELKKYVANVNQMFIEEKLKMKSGIEHLINKTFPSGDINELRYKNSTEDVSASMLHQSKVKIDLKIPEVKVDDINNERLVLLLIFCHLDSVSLLMCSQVCHLWRECSLHPEFWNKIVISDCSISNGILANFAKRCGETHTIILRNLREENFNVKSNNLELGLELMLHSSQNCLQTFAVINCRNLFTSRIGWLLSCYCRQLLNFVYISDVDCVSSEVIWSLGAGCRKLKSLIIPPLLSMKPQHQLSNRSLSTIGKAFPHLKVLCVGGHQIDIRGLILIAKCCQQLQSLELSNVGAVRENSAIELCQNGLTQLSHLFLTFTAITPKAILLFYNHCSNLEKIVVQLNLSVYYPNPIYHTRENIEKYKENIKHIKALSRKSRLARILSVKSDM